VAELTVLTDVIGTTTYIGESVPGTSISASAWRIVQVIDTTSGTTFYYADADSTFTKAWSQRGAYTYSS